MTKYKVTRLNQRAVQQFNGREGETATLLSRCPLTRSCVLAVSPHVISAVIQLSRCRRLGKVVMAKLSL